MLTLPPQFSKKLVSRSIIFQIEFHRQQPLFNIYEICLQKSINRIALIGIESGDFELIGSILTGKASISYWRAFGIADAHKY